MRQPQGFVDSTHSHHICHLRKAIYVLRQAPRAWYSHFSQFLLSQGFRVCQMDHSLFLRHQPTSVIFLLLYINDIIVTGNSSTSILGLMHALQSHFDMRHLVELSHFLGIEFIRSP